MGEGDGIAREVLLRIHFIWNVMRRVAELVRPESYNAVKFQGCWVQKNKDLYRDQIVKLRKYIDIAIGKGHWKITHICKKMDGRQAVIL